MSGCRQPMIFVGVTSMIEMTSDQADGTKACGW